MAVNMRRAKAIAGEIVDMIAGGTPTELVVSQFEFYGLMEMPQWF